MTARRRIALIGAALSVVGIALANRLEAASFVLAFTGGLSLGIAAAFAAVRERRETFGAPGVAFILWLAPVLGVLFLWFVVTWEPPPN
jgi:hypothetical protein